MMYLAQVAPSIDIGSIIQHGGTAGLILFMFWLIWDERKKVAKLEDERAAMIRETVEATNKMTNLISESQALVKRNLEITEKVVDVQKDILAKIKGAAQ